ncbi:hypothetical protein FB565_000506 [Actinoplanes lutulentus]|uniref:Uncharacterized protein n=1 Tax=Actinoplanes lutulentus TaxID=1287878 RepID=A0A327ZJV4_9ACTN|nr:hypothetical protein [Actinoplanes lutulentus]MBB2940802.1 hypothetical protein [Actinoplanes lutulentus]RAK43112.1 hypothetical protein B0I29_101242 [Actinoplanes lutulentus]
MRRAAILLLLLTGACAAGDEDVEVSASAAVAGSSRVMPYVDVVSGAADISAITAATGQKDFTAAFVLAGAGESCTPAWSGTTAIDDSAVRASLAEIGGEVVAATGGADGTYLEAVCSAGRRRHHRDLG